MRSVPASSTVRIPGMLAPSLEFRYSVKHEETDKSRHKRSRERRLLPHCSVSRLRINSIKQSTYLFIFFKSSCSARVLHKHPAATASPSFKMLPVSKIGLPWIEAVPLCVNKCACVWSKCDVRLGAKAQRQQCGPLLTENTGPLLMFRPEPFQSTLLASYSPFFASFHLAWRLPLPAAKKLFYGHEQEKHWNLIADERNLCWTVKVVQTMSASDSFRASSCLVKN